MSAGLFYSWTISLDDDDDDDEFTPSFTQLATLWGRRMSSSVPVVVLWAEL